MLPTQHISRCINTAPLSRAACWQPLCLTLRIFLHLSPLCAPLLSRFSRSRGEQLSSRSHAFLSRRLTTCCTPNAYCVALYLFTYARRMSLPLSGRLFSSSLFYSYWHFIAMPLLRYLLPLRKDMPLITPSHHLLPAVTCCITHLSHTGTCLLCHTITHGLICLSSRCYPPLISFSPLSPFTSCAC